MNLYVSNIAFDIRDSELKKVFEEFGKVDSVEIIKDRRSGMPRGYGFVEMPNEDEAKAAIAGLNDREINERPLSVNRARPKGEGHKPRGGGFKGKRKGSKRTGSIRGGGRKQKKN